VRERGIAHILLLIALVVATSSAVVFFKSDFSKSTETPRSNVSINEPTISLSKPTPDVAPDIFGFEPPDFYPHLEWVVVSEEKQQLNKLRWDSLHSKSGGVIEIQGTEWIAYKRLSSKDEANKFYQGNHPFEYYRSWLYGRKWDGTFFSVEDYQFSVLSRMGVNENSEGFYKIKDDKIRFVYFSEYVDKKFVNVNSHGFLYPHVVEYRVFVGPIIPVKNLVDQVMLSL
jgi:hypothetical protein